MVKARGIARLGMLAVGLGIGAAVASGNAWADTSTDWLSSLDYLAGGLPTSAADTSDLNLAISIDGATIFQEGTAHATTGTDGDIAFANGPDTYATATGTDDYAGVDGEDASAVSGGTGASDDTAFIFGDDDTATAGGTNGTFDGAAIFGNGDSAEAGSNTSGTGSYDVAYVEGNDLGNANATGQDWFIDILKIYGDSATATAATADSGNLLTDATSGAADTANLADLLSSLGEGAASSGGNFLTDLASLF
jgi:hypothetical protein